MIDTDAKRNGLTSLSRNDLPHLGPGENVSTCPDCSEHRKKKSAKCFSANGDHGGFFCNHCGFEGILDEFKTFQGSSFSAPAPDRSKYSKRQESPVSMVNPKPKKSAKKNGPVSAEYIGDHCRGLTKEAATYLESRGISRETMRVAKISSATHFGGRSLAIPAISRDTGKASFIKFRSFGGEKTLHMTNPDPDLIFVGQHLLDSKPETITIVEGEIDYLTAIECGIRNVLSVPNGAGPGKIDRALEDAAGVISSANTVVLALDGDSAGRAGVEYLASRIDPRKVRTVSYPDGFKDINEVIMDKGAMAVVDILTNTSPYSVPGIIRPDDVRDDLKALIGQPAKAGQGFPGFPMLSELCRIEPRMLYTVSGAPNAGKSTIVRELCLDLVGGKDAGEYAIAFFASEDAGTNAAFYNLWVEMLLGKPAQLCTESEIDRAVDNLRGRVVLFQVEAGNFDDIIEKTRFSILRDNVKLLVIDPWTEVEIASSTSRENTKHVIDRHISYLRDFGKAHDIAILVVLHPNGNDGRTMARGESGGMYATANTSGWVNKADHMMEVLRQEDGTNVVQVNKVRGGTRIGRHGKIVLAVDPVTGQLTEREGFYPDGSRIAPSQYEQQGLTA